MLLVTEDVVRLFGDHGIWDHYRECEFGKAIRSQAFPGVRYPCLIYHFHLYLPWTSVMRLTIYKSPSLTPGRLFRFLTSDTAHSRKGQGDAVVSLIQDPQSIEENEICPQRREVNRIQNSGFLSDIPVQMS